MSACAQKTLTLEAVLLPWNTRQISCPKVSRGTATIGWFGRIGKPKSTEYAPTSVRHDATRWRVHSAVGSGGLMREYMICEGGLVVGTPGS